MNAPLAGFEERRLAELKEYVAARAHRRPRRRLALALAASVAAVAVTGAAILTSGGEPAYAVTVDDDGIVYVQVRDFRDADGLNERLRSLGVPAIVDYVPYGMMCREPRAKAVENVPPGLYHAPTNIPGERDGWQMRIDTRLFEPGQTFVWTMTATPHGTSARTVLMHDPVAPCDLVPDDRRMEIDRGRPATRAGGPLDGVEVAGRTVGEVSREVSEHGLPWTVRIIDPDPDAPEGFIMYARKQGGGFKDHYIVWAADETSRGELSVITLLVTEKRYPDNPVKR